MSSYATAVAPSDLEAGYLMPVSYGGSAAHLQVPPGGVRAGQTFQGLVVVSNNASDGPTGRWRDDICSCCAPGFCPIPCLYCFFLPAGLLGQVMTRLSYKQTGVKTKGIFIAMLIFAVSMIVFQAVDISTLHEVEVETDDDATEFYYYYQSKYPILSAISGALSLALFILTCVYRGKVREAYNIPGDCCSDCCCAWWCTPCVIGQLARHTADYATQSADCCSSTGLVESMEQGGNPQTAAPAPSQPYVNPPPVKETPVAPVMAEAEVIVDPMPTMPSSKHGTRAEEELA